MATEEIKNSILNLTKICHDIRDTKIEVDESFKADIINEVKDAVNITVNGKIDKILVIVNNQDAKIDTLIGRSTPMIKQYEDRMGFWNTISVSSKNLGWIVAIIASIVVLFQYVKILSNN